MPSPRRGWGSSRCIDLTAFPKYNLHMKYVRCVKNEGFIHDQNGKPFDDILDDLALGQVYVDERLDLPAGAAR